MSLRLETGLVIGKFLPPHLGHLYLIGCALRQVQRLFIVVEHIEGERIPSTLRVSWLRQLVPAATILHRDHAMPQTPSAHPRFWELWRNMLLDLLPSPPEVVFASESYGHRLATELGARFLPVDPARQVVPISGTTVRADPESSAPFLPDPVRKYFGMPPRPDFSSPHRVALVGPESTGKSTLARKLAARFGAYVVPEYAETMILAGVTDSKALSQRDFEDFARGQRASESTLAGFGGSLLFCDSDTLTTQLYAERILGKCPLWIAEEAERSSYDLTLLFAPDVPWQDDHHRIDRLGRDAFFDDMKARLSEYGRHVVVLSGSWKAREQTAVWVCTALLKEKGNLCESRKGFMADPL